MTYEYKEVQTCAEHGFALSPDGTCLRCRNQTLKSAARRRLSKIVGAGLLVGTVLASGAAALSSVVNKAEAEPPRSVETTLSQPAIARETLVRTEKPARTTSRATHKALRDWEIEMARLDGKQMEHEDAERRRAAAAAQRRDDEAVRDAERILARNDTRAEPHGHISTNLPSSEDHPAWWQDSTSGRRRSCGCSLGQRMAFPVGTAPAVVAASSPGAPGIRGYAYSGSRPGH